MKYLIQPLMSQPGFQRDGTPYDSKNYVGGQWTRFYRGKPRKIGGYKLIDYGKEDIIIDGITYSSIVNSMFSCAKPDNLVDIFLGRPLSLSVLPVAQGGFSDVEVDRTPPGLPANPNNKWSMDLFTFEQEALTTSYLVAHCAPNNSSISSTTEGGIYYGDINTIDPLAPILDQDDNPVVVSGGIVYIAPFIVAYGNDGTIFWSPDDGSITPWNTLTNSLVVSNTKIVKAFPARGGGSTLNKGSVSPAVLLWTLNSLIRATYTSAAGEQGFGYEVIQSDISILAPNSVVQYNQMFFWIGENQFYFFNGIVNKLENEMNSDFFFNNLNYEYRSKIFGVVNPRFDEIWWFYPSGSSTENDSAIIFNVKYQIWYDTKINRASGLIPVTFSKPILADSAPNPTPTFTGLKQQYPIWYHEFNYDKIIGQNAYAIESWFQTHFIDLFTQDPSNSNLLYTRRIQPDFNQIGEMTVAVSNLMYPNDTPIFTGPFIFDSTTRFIDDVTSQGAIVSFIFSSNVLEGYYQMGKTLLNYTVGNEIK